MSIALLATGDELVIGDTLNTNSQQLAHALNSEGLVLGVHLVCGDDEEAIRAGLAFLAIQHDIIIVTGGLGPTSDDRTRFALAQFMAVALQEYPSATKHIESRLRNAQLRMTTMNRQQALFPPEAILLANPLGTAMGCAIQWKSKQIYLLPGPPRECLPMFNHYVLPALAEAEHSNSVLLKWRLFGTAEGQIAQSFDEALEKIDCETGYRLEMPYLECKVRCKPNLVKHVKDIIEPLVAPYLIATPEKKASEQLAEFLAVSSINVAIIDQATGGALQTLIQRPDNYQKICFFKKENVDFYFEISGLESYWQQQISTEKLILTLKCTFKNNNVCKSHQEDKTLPHRSSLVLQHAAEWLSFRIFHLINTLH